MQLQDALKRKSPVKKGQIPKGAKILKTRFGDLPYTPEQVYSLPRGIYGFEEYTQFVLLAIPGVSTHQFMLFCSLTDEDITFILHPLNVEATFIESKDLVEAVDFLGILPEHAQVFFITTVRPDLGTKDKMGFSINLQAPVILDRLHQQAWQHIFKNYGYSVQHIL